MNPGFILILSILIQLFFTGTINALFPAFEALPIYPYIKIPLTSVLSIFLPSYLYLKKDKKSYFTDFSKDVKIDRLIFLAAAIGLCTQFTGILFNLPANILIDYLGKTIPPKIPAVRSVSEFFVSVISFAFIPALFEEIMFRGIVFRHFRKYGDTAAIVLSALLFSIMHFSIGNLLGTFVLGIVFGYIFSCTNRLIYAVIAHFTLNFTASFVSLISLSPILSTFYSDYIFVFIVVSIPLLIYLLKIFSTTSFKHNYEDMDKYNYTSEFVFDIDEENCIKIYEHDIRENNMGLAFKELISSPYFYALAVIFIYLEGRILW